MRGEVLGTGLAPHDGLEVAHHVREGRRAHHGPDREEVPLGIRGVDVEGGVDRLLQGGLARLHRDHLRAQQAHAHHVRALLGDVDRAHVDLALQADERRGGRERDPVLAGTGLGDQGALAHPLRQQRLADRVVDLVGTGVVEVLALEQDPGPAELVGEPVGARDRGGAADDLAQQARVLREELLVVPGLLVGGGDLRHRLHERRRQDRAAVVAEATAGVPGEGGGAGERRGLGEGARGGSPVDGGDGGCGGAGHGNLP